MEDSHSTPSISRFNAADIGKHLDKNLGKAEQDSGDSDSEIPSHYKTSSSSTIYYHQEPYNTFSERVARLCSREFGIADITIERMRGGTYNRITAITVKPFPTRTLSLPWFCSFFSTSQDETETQNPKRYILRTLRTQQSDDDWGIAYDAPTLKFARRIFGSVVPDIVRMNVHPDNVLLQPYTIQERLPGQNLNRIWRSLTIAQKECVVLMIVHLMKKLQTVQNTGAGVIARTSFPEGLPDKISLHIHTFKVGHSQIPASIGPYVSPAISQTTLDFLRGQARRWEKLDDYDDNYSKSKWGQFMIIAQSLHDMGFISDDDKFYFCHLDLYPRNILVEIDKESSLKLKGVLDWDAGFAHFCPKFVAYRAPFWLWLDEGLDEWNEMLAATEPTDPELLRLKRQWEQLASDEWKRYAFTPEYMIARRMFTRLRDGICRVGDYEEAESIVNDWQKLHHDERLITVEVFHDSCSNVSHTHTDGDDWYVQAQLRREAV